MAAPDIIIDIDDLSRTYEGQLAEDEVSTIRVPASIAGTCAALEVYVDASATGPVAYYQVLELARHGEATPVPTSGRMPIVGRVVQPVYLSAMQGGEQTADVYIRVWSVDATPAIHVRPVPVR